MKKTAYTPPSKDLKFWLQCMGSRVVLPIPASFDTRQCSILIYEDSVTQRFVRVPMPMLNYSSRCCANTVGDFYVRAHSEAERHWGMKYSGAPLPNTADAHWCERTIALPHLCCPELTLSAAEVGQLQQKALQANFTLELLYIIKLGLSWKLGEPVAEDHEGWASILAEEYDQPGALRSTRQMLGMPISSTSAKPQPQPESALNEQRVIHIYPCTKSA